MECAVATFLARIGRFSYRRRWLVAGLWLLLLALAGSGAATLSGTMSNSFTIPGTEAQQAIDQLAARFPQAHGGAPRHGWCSSRPRGRPWPRPPTRPPRSGR